MPYDEWLDGSSQGAHILRLGEFSLEETSDLLQRLVGNKVAGETRDRFFEMTRGNPLMTALLAREVAEHGELPTPESLQSYYEQEYRHLLSRDLPRAFLSALICSIALAPWRETTSLQKLSM
jgi:hypothetical protein